MADTLGDRVDRLERTVAEQGGKIDLQGGEIKLISLEQTHIRELMSLGFADTKRAIETLAQKVESYIASTIEAAGDASKTPAGRALLVWVKESHDDRVAIHAEIKEVKDDQNKMGRTIFAAGVVLTAVLSVMYFLGTIFAPAIRGAFGVHQ